jgi:hypothetical protein
MTTGEGRADEQITHQLGMALIEVWGRLPQDVQRVLFEAAVRRAGESMREPIATVLHEHHPRTVD